MARSPAFDIFQCITDVIYVIGNQCYYLCLYVHVTKESIVPDHCIPSVSSDLKEPLLKDNHRFPICDKLQEIQSSLPCVTDPEEYDNLLFPYNPYNQASKAIMSWKANQLR